MHQEIYVNCNIQETRVAFLENKKLEEFFIERSDAVRIAGNIYKGIVDSVLPGMGSAFINMGLERNGFLYVSDVVAPELTYENMLEDVEEEAPRDHKPKRMPPINELLKKGDEILVQVVKEPIGTKGARLTTHVSIPGHFVVLMPYGGTIGISKRIESREERERIKAIIKEIKLPNNAGMIVRTAAEGVEKKDLIREVKYLMRLWARIKDRAKRCKAPNAVYEEYSLVLRIARDMLTKKVSHIEIDGKNEYRQLVKFLNAFSPRLKAKAKLYRGKIPLFERYDINRQIDKICSRTVKLKCGGYLVIDQTEGLVVIDVNSGKFVGRRNLEDTVYKTNLEAAEEIARQIRLRDLGGIIAIDFIDMAVHDHRRRVFKTLTAAIERDKAKTKVLNMSSLGVVEMSRQRMRKSLEGVVNQECPYCNGKGLIKSPSTISIELGRRLERFFAEGKRVREVIIMAHPDIANYLLNPERRLVRHMERMFRRRIRVVEDPRLHIEDVRIEEKTIR